MRLTLALILAAAGFRALCAEPGVSADGRITFHLKAPNAKEVKVISDAGAIGPMTKDEKGVWSVTTEPLAPDIYWYVFLVDGQGFGDPENPLVKTGVRGAESLVRVPGAENPVWFEKDVPRGTLHEQVYRSVAGMDRNLVIYTPPGYGAGNAKYPVLYLLHGLGDDERNWTMVGRADVVLDNLIAGKRAVPMIVVMPNGLFPRGSGGDQMFEKDLLESVIPLVETTYRVETSREGRAVAGLSLGGGQALGVGLSHKDLFAWVGSFSSGNVSNAATRYADFLEHPETGGKLKLLYIGCGEKDPRLENTKKFDAMLSDRGIGHVFAVYPGGHEWVVFRRNFAEIAPLLFRER